MPYLDFLGLIYASIFSRPVLIGEMNSGVSWPVLHIALYWQRAAGQVPGRRSQQCMLLEMHFLRLLLLLSLLVLSLFLLLFLLLLFLQLPLTLLPLMDTAYFGDTEYLSLRRLEEPMILL